MTADTGFFIEAESYSVCEHGQAVSGDICIQRRTDRRCVLVICDGMGSGVKANIVAGVISSMAVNYVMSGESPLRAASTILKTFPPSDESRSATFTIIDIRAGGKVTMVEYGNPSALLLRNSVATYPERVTVEVAGHKVNMSSFVPGKEDRIIIVSDGVTGSGKMTRRLPEGWGLKGVEEFCIESMAKDRTISARALSRVVIERAELNDLFTPKNDMSCAVVYFRDPRRIIVSSGPPFNENKDDILADLVSNYKGTRLICGGTTAKIIARELGRKINVELKRDPAGLPPTSRMNGVDLITEGVLTLSKVRKALEEAKDGEINRKGTDGRVARMLLEHDVIEFVVGTRINPIHQDPNLPVELELRRNLIKDLAWILSSRYMKEVKVQYI